MQIKKPNLFIVGAPKCGTSSLFNYLGQHPDVANSLFKEPSYFCSDIHQESDKYHKKKNFFPIRTEKKYLKLFSHTRNEKIVCEASGQYIYSKVAAQQIHRFNPKAKIIIMIRNPIDLLYALHSEGLFWLIEDITDFDKALEAEKLRKKGKGIPKNAVVPSNLFYSETVKFTKHIKKYLVIFPKKQIKIIIFDDFAKKTSKTYKDILDFIDVDSDFIPDFKIINLNKKLKSILFQKILIWLASSFIGKILPLKLRKCGHYFGTLNTKESKRPPIESRLKSKLIKTFKPEVIKINKFLNEKNFINRDLVKLWRYNDIE